MLNPVTVYAGPSIQSGPLASLSEIDVRAPIRDGDLEVLWQTSAPGGGVLIIDGVFGAGQSITLTEIREAIQRGLLLFGSTSMGALRAVEAGPLGMHGLGEIFSEYASGFRTRDADVALLHDEFGAQLTVPMVNIELLAVQLERRGQSPEAVREFVRQCQAIHFTERDLDSVAQVCRSLWGTSPGSPVELLSGDGLPVWDRKTQDAQQAVTVFLSLTQPLPPAPVAPAPHYPGQLLGSGF